MATSIQHRCLFCDAPLTHIFADLGTCPPSNAFLTEEQCAEPEVFHPLQAWVCSECLLVQGPHYKRPEDIFNHDYAYHSSYSTSWVEHARRYIEDMKARFSLTTDSFILEVGSNDGYLLQHAMKLRIPCLGVDPSTGAASVAQAKGIPTITTFFTQELAERLLKNNVHADLICGINVFAHVPDINDFVAGMALLLKPEGVITMEIAHLKSLVENRQFDTIYHEHYFYHTLSCLKKIVEAHGLRLFDVEELPTHGGSLRIYACHKSSKHLCSGKVDDLLHRENMAGMNTLEYYLGFQEKIDSLRLEVMRFLMDAKEQGKLVAGYGAAAKGNTLINYFGIRKDLLPFVVDASPIKQGKFLPGSRIPVVAEAKIKEVEPDYVLIFPWNLKDEIGGQLSYIRDWGGKFATTIPTLNIW